MSNTNTRLKFLLKLFPLSLLTVIAIMVFSVVYSSGKVHMFPRTFVVDNQQRVYLLFHNGVFVGKDNWMIAILPNDVIKDDQRLSVSEDNLLTYERGTKVSVYDLNQSEPEKRKLVLIRDSVSFDKLSSDFNQESNKRDEQNGIFYTYQRTLLSYKITQSKDGESSLFYQMPSTDMIWNLIVNLYILAMTLGILIVIYQFVRMRFAEQSKSTEYRLVKSRLHQ